jgi:superfamily II DNA or RNA helicase
LQPDAIVPGDTIWLRQQRWRVERLRRDHDVVRLDLANHHGRRTFWLPFDRADRLTPRVRLKRRRARAAMARLAALLARTRQARGFPALVDATLTILPHQLEPALAISAGVRRVLLADEVGLGKTLQAAIVIAEIVRRDAAARVLVIVPAPIVTQWIGELRTRFGLPCGVADRGGLDDAGREMAIGSDAWRRSGIWIATLDFLKQPHVLEAMPGDPWDLVIVDEAHTACGHTERHSAAGRILQRARRLMLLTATPHSGDEERYTRLLDLGAVPGLHEPLTIFRRSRAGLGLASTRRVRWPRVRLSAREAATLDALAEFERVTTRAAGAARLAGATLLLSVFRKRALSTMAALAVSLDRRASWLERTASAPADGWRQPAFTFDADVEDEASLALTAVTGLDVAVEQRWLKRLIALARAAAAAESKLAWIARLLARTVEPVILFTEFRDSLDAARARLERRRMVAVVHGGQRDEERDAQLAAFLDGGATVLIATDVAGQGLNLQQRSRWVINLELPWNPVRLEQRAGRVDRIGQTRGVHITSTIAQHDAEAGLLARLARRSLAARRALDADSLPIVPAAAIAEREIADALLLGEPLSARPLRTAPICRRWERHGRVVARSLTRRRQLAARWHGAAPDATTAVRATLDRLPAVARLARWCLVFVVPILDGAGVLLESCVVAIGPASSCRHKGVDDADITAAAIAATRVASARARRLSRAQATTAAAAEIIERALEAAVNLAPVSALQPGLFDRRAEQRAHLAAERRTAAGLAHARRREALVASAQIRIGTASLVAVMAGRR